MQVTDIVVIPLGFRRLRAYVNVVFDDCFVVRGIKIIHGHAGRRFISMPSRRVDGAWSDICPPLTPDFRNSLETAILPECDRALASGVEPLPETVDADWELFSQKDTE